MTMTNKVIGQSSRAIGMTAHYAVRFARQRVPTGTDKERITMLNIDSIFNRIDLPSKPVAQDWESLRNAAKTTSERAEIDAIFCRPPFVD